ncbi:hypothetical protein M407DRAFT_29947 [Tulasnella calospora MUT 4182]|uniref:F-box domain-containing protein n=1 Tax=Tulasnella calospora MUT 4182 TaxID=1051891 RepID=A0A0C3LG57_9AGAM|nr:hypothetical protein M407DRAFT_29947 [Tulasnella calospora MUT 4182]
MATPKSVSQLAPGAVGASVAATIRREVDTFLVDLFNKPDWKAAIELHPCQIVESAVRRRRNDRVPFNQLSIDVIYCVFAELLELDRIYDPTFPTIAIERHRKNLFTVRRVSTVWNDFLVSSPRYWPAVNIGNDRILVKLAITRAQILR